MGEKTQDILLRIGITGDKSVDDLKKKNTELLKSVLENQKQIDNLAKANKELAKAEGDNSDAIAQNILKQKELQAANKISQSQIGQNITLITAEMGALTEKRAQLANMTLEYSRLSAAEKEDIEIGVKMQQSIKALSDDLKAEEKQIGITARNVGNYTDSIVEAMKQQGLNNTIVGRSIETYKDFKDSAMAASGGTGVLNGAMKMLAANPLMAIIALAAMLFMALKEAIGKNAQIMDNLKVAMAPVTKLFGTLFSWLGKIVEIATGAFAKAMTFISSLFGDAGKSAIAYQNALKQLDDIQDAMLNKKILDKNLQEEINKLYEISNDRTKTAIERRTALISAIEKEKKMAKENADLQLAQLRASIVDIQNQYGIKGKLLEKDNTLTKEALDKLSEEDKNRLAGMVSQYQDFYNKKSELDKDSSKKLSLLNNSITEEEKSEIEKRKKAYEDYQKQKKDLIQKTEDALLEIIKNEKEKELKQLDLTYKRELEAITGKTKEANDLRAALKQKYNSDQAAINKKYSDEEIQKEVDKATKEIELKLSIAKAGSQQELDLRIQQLNLMRASELEAAERLGIDKKLIEDKYNKQIADAKIDFNKQAIEKIKADQQLEFQNKIAQMQLDNQNTLQFELEEAIKRRDTLVQANDETEAQFTARKLKSEQDIKDITARMHQEEIQKIEMQQQIAEQIFSGLNSLGEIFAENSESLAEFAKVVGLFQIAVSTGVAIAKGIEGAMSVPFPANLLAITTTIATVLANVATAKKMLSSAGSAPKAPKLAYGGSVFGPGTGTSDSIPAYLSNGESVNTAVSSAMFAPLLSALNQVGGGAPIQSVNKSAEVYGEQFLANAFSKALINMPSPVVAVDEITRVNNRVKVIESMARQ